VGPSDLALPYMGHRQIFAADERQVVVMPRSKTPRSKNSKSRTSQSKQHRTKKRWVSGVTTDSTHPPKGLFTTDAATIARTLASKGVSPKGPGSGVRMLTYFINRAGHNLPATRRRELERAKKLLSQRIQKEKSGVGWNNPAKRNVVRSSRMSLPTALKQVPRFSRILCFAKARTSPARKARTVQVKFAHASFSASVVAPQ
jgi:hypothetical protein